MEHYAFSFDLPEEDPEHKKVVARRLMKTLNSLDPGDQRTKEFLLRELLGEMGRDVDIALPFYCCTGTPIRIGDGTLVNSNCYFLDGGVIEIGKKTMIGPCVQIYATNHPRISADDEEEIRYGIDFTTIKIGDYCWIGGGAIILPGVEISDGTTIGAGSIVTKSIPPRCVAVGNPCRPIRMF